MSSSTNSSISTTLICSQIRRHKDQIGITAEQIIALTASLKDSFPFADIISALRDTEYYMRTGEITPNTLKNLPDTVKKPIHFLFAAYYNKS